MAQKYGYLGRRHLVKLMGLAGVTYTAAVACAGQADNNAGNTSATPTLSPVAASPPPPRPDTAQINPQQALDMLVAGNSRFVAGQTTHGRQDPATARATGGAQYPFAAFLSCADSRVPVEVIFDQGVGDCFVTRVAGNIATKEVVGSLEFGTEVLGSKVLLVIGHERCGAVVASMGRLDTPLPKDPGSIPSLVPYITPAVQEVADFRAKGGTIPPDADGVADDIEFTAKDNVLKQVATLKKSPILAALIQQGKLLIKGAYYDLDTGKVDILPDKLV